MTTTDTEPIYYVGPEYDAGTESVNLGRAVGGGRAPWTLYTPGRIQSGIVAGPARSGVTNVLNVVALGALQSTYTTVQYIDFHRDVASPGLAAAAERTARTPVEARAMFHALARQRDDRRDAARSFVPSPSAPGVLVVIERLDAVLRDPGTATVFERLLPSLDTAGIGFAVSVPDLSLAGFAGSQRIRSHLAGNVVMLGRAFGIDPVSGAVIEVADSHGQDLPGAGYRKAAGGTDPEAVPFFQAYYAGDASDTVEWFTVSTRPRR